MEKFLTLYSPEDIACTLDKLTFNRKDTEDYIDALSWIKAAAQNEMNHDYWRALYEVLSELVYNRDSGRITEV